MSVESQNFFDPDILCQEVADKLSGVTDKVDYITVVPDGEPTLDRRLGELAQGLKRFGIPLAIISNASLIHVPAVRQALLLFDWVSLKVDAVTEGVWRKLDRPHPSLKLEEILDGICLFRQEFRKELNTETMLVKGYNDTLEELGAIAQFLGRVRPDTAWISLPLRPPAEEDVSSPTPETLQSALRAFREGVPLVELLNFSEGDAFSASGPDLSEAILEITSVHPIRETALRSLLARKGANWELVEGLLEDGSLLEKDWQGELFFRRNLENRA